METLEENVNNTNLEDQRLGLNHESKHIKKTGTISLLRLKVATFFQPFMKLTTCEKVWCVLSNISTIILMEFLAILIIREGLFLNSIIIMWMYAMVNYVIGLENILTILIVPVIGIVVILDVVAMSSWLKRLCATALG